jgi:23S rRNA pseudouridine955/2504/2580 synthase
VKNIEILHEDDISIIVNKPAGLAVQGGKGVKTSLDRLLAEIRTPPPLLVHRLDKDTSGILLAARGREAAALFSRLFDSGKSGSGGKVSKIYIAVCKGSPPQKEGVIKEDLLIDGRMKKAETRYKVLKTAVLEQLKCGFSVMEIELGTGRMHQIRRHLAMNGNPILGDDKYGDFSLNKKLRKSMGLKHLLLHAWRLIIKEYDIDITAPPPNYFFPYIS